MALEKDELMIAGLGNSLHGMEKHLKQAQEATTLEDRVEHLQDTVALLIAYIEGRKREEDRASHRLSQMSSDFF